MPDMTVKHLDRARHRGRQPIAPSSAPPALQLREVSAHAPDGSRLLSDVSFSVDAGTMVAVVGPTGAGKTSLANALTGSLGLTSGAITLHGQPLGDGLAAGRVGYVPQGNALHLGLSLRNALDHAAVLHLPAARGDERRARVSAVLDELGLAAHETTVVRDLSAGQRKRAGLAAQLLGDPDVVVLDEPTAGLDPGYERVVLDILRDLVATGRTIVVVTHSLEALKRCDRVVFLAAGGSVAFAGPPSQAAEYFETSDTAGVFLSLDTDPPPPWESSEPTAEYDDVVGASRRGRIPFYRQVAMLVRRQFDLIRTDRRHLAILLLQAPIIGGLLWAVLPANGLFVKDHNPGGRVLVVAMFIVLATTWLGVTNAYPRSGQGACAHSARGGRRNVAARRSRVEGDRARVLDGCAVGRRGTSRYRAPKRAHPRRVHVEPARDRGDCRAGGAHGVHPRTRLVVDRQDAGQSTGRPTNGSGRAARLLRRVGR